MSQLLLELLSEEIPALMQVPAASELFESVLSDISAATSNKLSGDYFVAPMRLGFYVDNIPNQIKRSSKEIRGPRLNARPSAIEGFMTKYGISSIELLQKDSEFFYFTEDESVEDAAGILKSVVEANLQKLVWPKSMRWGDYNTKWIRPIHSILCTFSGKILPVQYSHIAAGDTTKGHRFMMDKSIKVNSYEEYENALKAAFVEIKPANRRKIIESALQKHADTLEIELIRDKRLMDEVVGLVEYPIVMIGKINEKFMSLPKEVLITSLKVNQKYFMFTKKNGELAPFFGIVANTKCEGDNAVILGNERVLSARLSDACFFYNEDLKIKLADRINGLKTLSFNRQIGSVHVKMESATKIALNIGKQLGYAEPDKIKRATMLAKTDLLTEMVKEFPELQGIMGYHYAIENGEDQDVAVAIKEHYRPQGPGDSTPKSILGSIVALADKIDTLNQMFSHNIKPTGSKDLYALRRAAIGINRIITEHSLNIIFEKLCIREDVINFIRSKG